MSEHAVDPSTIRVVEDAMTSSAHLTAQCARCGLGMKATVPISSGGAFVGWTDAKWTAVGPCKTLTPEARKLEAAHTPTRAVLMLDDLALYTYVSRKEMKPTLAEAERSMRPHITLELRERGSAPVRKMWHPCETRFFDAK